MPADVGSQSLAVKFGASGSSANVNRRHKGIRPTGIYSGGYLTVVNNTTTSISALICEVTDGTHQLRVETTVAVSLTVSDSTPYIVLRWSYTGTTSDYAELLAVASGSLQTNDLIIGKCTFTGGGLLNGSVYDERSNPNTYDLFLKVEASAGSGLRVRIRTGRVQTNTANVDIDEQLSGLFVVPASNSRIDLVYIDTDGTIAIDATGTAAATPTAPSYAGRRVLAEVTLASTSTSITASMIKDVRHTISIPIKVDRYLATSNTSDQQTANGAFTKADLGTIKNQSGMGVSSNQITLAADRKYALSFGVRGVPSSGSSGDPTFKAKWVVASGDTSWDIEVISLVSAECADANDVNTHISNTVYIIPSEETILELHVYTQNTASKAQINLLTVNIMSI